MGTSHDFGSKHVHVVVRDVRYSCAVRECDGISQDNETKCHGQYTATKHSVLAVRYPR